MAAVTTAVTAATIAPVGDAINSSAGESGAVLGVFMALLLFHLLLIILGFTTTSSS